MSSVDDVSIAHVVAGRDPALAKGPRSTVDRSRLRRPPRTKLLQKNTKNELYFFIFYFLFCIFFFPGPSDADEALTKKYEERTTFFYFLFLNIFFSRFVGRGPALGRIMDSRGVKKAPVRSADKYCYVGVKGKSRARSLGERQRPHMVAVRVVTNGPGCVRSAEPRRDGTRLRIPILAPPMENIAKGKRHVGYLRQKIKRMFSPFTRGPLPQLWSPRSDALLTEVAVKKRKRPESRPGARGPPKGKRHRREAKKGGGSSRTPLSLLSQPHREVFPPSEEMELFRGMACIISILLPVECRPLRHRVLAFLVRTKTFTRLDVPCFVTAFAYLHVWLGGDRDLPPVLLTDGSRFPRKLCSAPCYWELLILTAVFVAHKFVEDDR